MLSVATFCLYVGVTASLLLFNLTGATFWTTRLTGGLEFADDTLKPGKCPEVDLDDACAMGSCEADADCPAMDKCCPGLCGAVCMQPVAVKQCPLENVDVSCNEQCEWGFKFGPDDCPLCECHDPCQGYFCPEGTMCQPVMNSCYTEPCIQSSAASCIDEPPE